LRALLDLEILGERVVGTHHPPRAPARDVGVLFINFGYMPRDGQGMLGVKMAEDLAHHGFHCFRVDLPPLGDSPGQLADDSEQWFDHLHAGGDAPMTVAIGAELRKRYRLRAIALGGLCGGAITSAYAYDLDPTGIAGIVLLDPSFYIPDRAVEPSKAAEEATFANAGTTGEPYRTTSLSGGRARLRRVAAKLFSYWTWMRVVTGESPYAKFIPIPKRAILALFALRKSELPTLANVPLVAAWQRAVASAVPVLVVTAQGKMRELYFDRVNRVALAGLDTRHVEHVRLPGTNHVFTTGGALANCVATVTRWAERRFPSPA
jgi:alpha-beta hydrolase superfamily lysophospholipase